MARPVPQRRPLSRGELEDGCPIYGGFVCRRIFMDRFSRQFNSLHRPLYMGVNFSCHDPRAPINQIIWPTPELIPGDPRFVTWPSIFEFDTLLPSSSTVLKGWLAPGPQSLAKNERRIEYREKVCIDLTTFVVCLSVVRRTVNGQSMIGFGLKCGRGGYSYNLNKFVSLQLEDTVDFAMTFALIIALSVVREVVAANAGRYPPINKVFIRAPSRHNLEYIYGALAYSIADPRSLDYLAEPPTFFPPAHEENIRRIHDEIGRIEDMAGKGTTTVKFWNLTRMNDVTTIDDIALQVLRHPEEEFVRTQ
ncbi:hypothetical protein B0T19DRAFT_438527 [Cercophora scortea]|uniref:Uncharacterized protein n=1 Tax=Cercophora scortea TaxID=314031 RepID=A0AAE0MHX0_9PEZI|nr:hypothetical protein B0T19DRAFT_438527 [Cercophora scortea]